MESLPEIISNNRNAALPWNHFDCATAVGFLLGHCVLKLIFIGEAAMFEAFLVVLSAGVFVAHAFDAYRWS